MLRIVLLVKCVEIMNKTSSYTPASHCVHVRLLRYDSQMINGTHKYLVFYDSNDSASNYTYIHTYIQQCKM